MSKSEMYFLHRICNKEATKFKKKEKEIISYES